MNFMNFIIITSNERNITRFFQINLSFQKESIESTQKEIPC